MLRGLQRALVCSFVSQRPKAQREDQINRECNVTTPAKKREVRFAQLVTRTKLFLALTPPARTLFRGGKRLLSGQPPR